jgi:hypothetical protein
LEEVFLRKNKEKIIDGICKVYLQNSGLNGFLAEYKEVLLCRRELIDILQTEAEVTFADLFSTPSLDDIEQGEYNSLEAEQEEQDAGPSNPWTPYETHIWKAGFSFNRMFKELSAAGVDVSSLVDAYGGFLGVGSIACCLLNSRD